MQNAAGDTRNDSAPNKLPRTRRPRTEEELFQREEQLALLGIASTAQRMVADLSAATGLRDKARKHPWITIALASCASVVVGATVWRIARAAAGWVVPWLLARGAQRGSTTRSPFDSLLQVVHMATAPERCPPRAP